MLEGSEMKVARLGFTSLLGREDRPLAFTKTDVLQQFFKT